MGLWWGNRVPWTPRRSNQSILKEISPGCSLEGLMLKLKLQYFGHIMRRVDSLEKTLGRIGGRRKRGWQGMRWLDGITDSMDMGLSKLQELVMDREACVLWFMGLQRVRHDWVTELNWTELNWKRHLTKFNSQSVFLTKQTTPPNKYDYMDISIMWSDITFSFSKPESCLLWK